MFREIIEEIKNTYKDGVYIDLKLTEPSLKTFKDFYSDESGFRLTESPHLTLIFSEKKFSGKIEKKNDNYLCEPKKYSIFGKENKVLVLELNSEKLLKRNSELMKKYNFVSNFEIYKPHITIGYEINDSFKISDLELPDFNLEFCCEDIQELDLDWKDS